MFSAVSYKVEGLNVASCINTLIKSGVRVDVSDKNARDCIITVKVKDSKKVLAYLKQRCYNILAVKPQGFYQLPYAVKLHPIIAVSFCLLLFAVAVFSQVCLVISVEHTDRDAVIRALDDYGIKKGSLLTFIGLDALENHLCNALNAAHVIVDIDGSTLSVEVHEKIDTPLPIDYNSAYDLLANHDGIITRIVTVAGTPQVEVGDYVTGGQVLIAGVRTYPDGTAEQIRAVGEVYARVSSQHTEQFFPQTIEYVLTNEYISVVSLAIGNITVSNKEAPQGKYQPQTQTSCLYPLNISVSSTKYYLLAEQIVYYTFADRQEFLCKVAKEKALEKADFDVKWTEYTIGNDSVTATVWAEICITQTL